jgi:hypothetical protein
VSEQRDRWQQWELRRELAQLRARRDEEVKRLLIENEEMRKLIAVMEPTPRATMAAKA